jgi:hypothetical protein
MPDLEDEGPAVEEIARLQAREAQINAVEGVVRDYHFALDTRQHGGIAAHKAIEAIMTALGMPWVAHAELRRREKKPG